MPWAYFSRLWPGVPVKENLNASAYPDILVNFSFQQFLFFSGITMQQAQCSDHKDMVDLEELCWPAQIPDQTNIKYLWD